MGGELNFTPIKEKKSFDGEGYNIKFGISEIQGWKKYMENYSFYQTNIGQNKDINIFGVFDGNGGREVPKYLSVNFPKTLLKNKYFKEGNYSKALTEAFIEQDNLFTNEDIIKELNLNFEQFKKSQNQEIIELNKRINNNNEENLTEVEIEQIKTISEMFDPRNLENTNIALFSGSSAIVIITTNTKVYIANSGNCKGVCFDRNGQIIKNKTTTSHTLKNEGEKKRIELVKNFNDKDNKYEFIKITRGFGYLDYKDNKLLKPEDQAITVIPEIIEINMDDLGYLIVGSSGFFEGNSAKFVGDKLNQSIGDYFIKEIEKNIGGDSNKKISTFIEDYFETLIPIDLNENTEQIGLGNMTCLIIKPINMEKIITEKESEKTENTK